MSTIDTPLHTPDASIWPSAIKWGLISGIVGIILTMVYYNMGLMDPTNTTGSILGTLVQLGIGLAIVFFGLKSFRDSDNGGHLTLGKGMFWSLGYGLISGIIGGIFAYIFFTYLAPDFIDGIMELQSAQMEEQGLGDDEIEAAQGMVGMFMSPAFFAISGLLGQIFYSVVQGLVASLILKTR